MKYRLKGFSIWEQGHYRDNQEDNIYPKQGQITDNDRLFVLCDGMGGHDKGEVASRIVCDSFADYADKHFSHDGIFEDQQLEEATGYALDQLDANDDGSVKKMGTTLTFLKLHVGGATIGHIGDSRVYHIRPGKGVEDTQILLCTRDHSLVSDLVKIGEITEEEARNHPQKNVITRCMMPHQERRPKVEIDHVTDIQSGDYFFMCSDGMLDQMEDENLKFIFSKPDASDEEKVEMLKGSSLDSHDNHSAHIIHILAVEDYEEIRKTTLTAILEDNVVLTSQESKDAVFPTIGQSTITQIHTERKKTKVLIAVIAFLILSIVVYMVMGGIGKEMNSDTRIEPVKLSVEHQMERGTKKTQPKSPQKQPRSEPSSRTENEMKEQHPQVLESKTEQQHEIQPNHPSARVEDFKPKPEIEPETKADKSDSRN